jgi:hypothetical protein
MQEYATEQQPCSQHEESDEGEDEDEIQLTRPTRGESEGTNRYHHRKKESLQHQDREVGDETIDTASISQDRHHGVEPCHEDDEDDENEDA